MAAWQHTWVGQGRAGSGSRIWLHGTVIRYPVSFPGAARESPPRWSTPLWSTQQRPLLARPSPGRALLDLGGSIVQPALSETNSTATGNVWLTYACVCTRVFMHCRYLTERAEILQSAMWWVAAAENFRTLEKFLFSSLFPIWDKRPWAQAQE